MLVAGGSTNVTTSFALRLTADGKAATGLTITGFDLQYVRSGVAPVAKVDATALAATDSAHADNKAIEIDATDQPGLYRVDWPDAAFAAGVREVILTVKVATAFTEHLRVEIDGEVTAEALGTQAKADVNAECDTAISDAALATAANLATLTDALVLTSATIETVTSQTQFVIPATADAVDNDAYNGAVAVFIDDTDPNQKSTRLVTDYNAATRTITVGEAPDFTITTADTLTVLNVATARLLWQLVLTGADQNFTNSAGRRLRALQEFQGYPLGALWIDTVNGTAGTTAFENGTVNNPSNNLADAITLAAALGLVRFIVANGSSITFAEAHTNEVWGGLGRGWALALGGQDISGTHILLADVSGTATTPTGKAHIEDCEIGTATLGLCHLIRCSLATTLTLSVGGDYLSDDCTSEGSAGAIIDTGAAVANVHLDLHRFSGEVELQNVGQAGTDTVHVFGLGELTINANCIGGTIEVRGPWEVVDNGTSTVNLDDLANNVVSVQADTDDIQTRLPAALVGGRMDASVGAMAANVLNAAAIAANALTAAKFAADSIDAVALATTAIDEIAAAILATPANLLATDGSGRVDLGAVEGDTPSATAFRRAVLGNVIGTASGTPTTTSIPTSSLLPAAAAIDQFKGRILTFDKDTTTANLRGQATEITANTAAGVLTVTALTTAPVSGDTFTIT